MKRWILCVLFTALGCGGDQAVTDEAEQTDPFQEQLTLWEDGVELFYHHSQLVAGLEGQSWAVHVTDLETFAPASEGTVRMQFLGPSGADFETVVTAPDRDGLFTPEPVFPVGGAYDLTVSIERSGRVHEVYVGPIIVYPTQADVPDLPTEEAVGIAFLKEQQWAIPFATTAATRRDISSSVAATGEVIPAAGRMAAVAAPLEGIIRAAAGRGGPVPGQWVDEGDVLTVLSPASYDAGYAQLRAREERLRREVERAERLLAAEAIPARRLREAEHDLEVVRASLEALGASESTNYEFALRAPISGYVNERHAVAGARAAAGDPLFTIVDARVVWIRLDVSAADAGAATRATGATFTVEGNDRVYRSSRLVSVGRVIDPTRRTLPALVEIENADQSLKVGMLARGRLLLGDAVSGVAIPTTAVREEDGLFVAYVQIGGESFERRALTLGPGDGEWTIVESGVRNGERVVTLGAYQVKLSSLNTSAISDHGHPH